MLLTGCVRTQTEYEAVKIPSLPLPENLLADCRIPDIPDEMAYADSVVLNLLMQGALEDCTNQIRAIKKIEANS
ncbi:Rz1-like lysis system protein LysC [Rahnella bonaserana]|uniref:Rz1-like lysis system protein LysC n=1 Tax=Rahnella bonaserana TaxID=2816248 RepID=UPI003D17C9F8